MKWVIKLLVLIILLSVIALGQGQAPPTGYVGPVAMAGMGPNGLFAETSINGSGALVTSGSTGTFFQLTGYVGPVAPVAQDASGNWHYLQVDGTGALKTSGGAGGGVTITTVSGLNSIPGKTDGTVASVTDGNTATDCTVGGGSNNVFCRYTGTVWGTFSGGSASAGGANTQIQFNSSGSLGGITQFTTNGTTTITAGATGVLDLHSAATSGFLLPGGLASGIVKVTTATGAITSVAAPAGAVVGDTDAQTLTNKTLTNPTINAAALSGTITGAPTFSGNLTLSGNLSLTGTDTFSHALACVSSGSCGIGSSGTPFGEGYFTQTTTTDDVIKGSITGVGNTGFLLHLVGFPSAPTDAFTVDVNGVTTVAGNATFSSNVTVQGSSGVSVTNGPITSGSAGAAQTALAGVTGAWGCVEGSVAGTPTATADYIRCDSTAHQIKISTNGAAEQFVPQFPTGTTTQHKLVASTSTSNLTQYQDGRDVKIIPFCVSPGGTAGSGVTYAAGQWTPTNRAGTNNIGCGLQGIPNTGATLQFMFELPLDWDTSSQPFISLIYASGANTSGTVIWTLSSGCSKEDGSITDDPTFNAESAFATQTMAVANRTWGQNGQFTAMTSGNNCIAGSPVIVKAVLSGTAASAINAYQAVVTIPVLPTIQAN